MADLTTTSLYRLHADDGQLLYIGVAGNPGRRFEQHRASKTWWGDVARIDLEHHPTREDALAAERAAILAEHPTHNVVHNRNATRTTTPAKETTIVEPTRLALLQVGDWAALGLSDGTCPVGQIVAVDEHGIAVQLVSFVSGYLMDRVQIVPWSLLVKAEAQYPEFVDTDDRGAHVVNLDPLGAFQSDWKRAEETP